MVRELRFLLRFFHTILETAKLIIIFSIAVLYPFSFDHLDGSSFFSGKVGQ